MKNAAIERETRLFLGLVAFSLLGSLFSRLSHLNPGPIAPVASVLTLGSGVWATFAEYFRAVPMAGRRIGGALVLGAACEILGLATGFPFGRYVYTSAWWPTVNLWSLGSFPLMLPFAWLLMAGASSFAATSWLGPRTWPWWRPAVLGGLLAAVIDLGMEPVMTGHLNYWRWLSPGPLPGGAPVGNFVGWWATGALAGVLLTVGIELPRSMAPRWVLGGFVVLVAGLGVIG